MKHWKIILGVCVLTVAISFITFAGSFVYFYNASPHRPLPSSGRVYPLRDGNSVVYVSKVANDVIWSAFWTSIGAFLVTCAIVAYKWPERVGRGRKL